MKNDMRPHEWIALAIMMVMLVGIFAYGMFVLLM